MSQRYTTKSETDFSLTCSGFMSCFPIQRRCQNRKKKVNRVQFDKNISKLISIVIKQRAKNVLKSNIIYQDMIMKHHSHASSWNDVLFVLAWVAWVGCLREWRTSVCGVAGVLAWVACSRGRRGWRACMCSVGWIGGVLVWMACY